MRGRIFALKAHGAAPSINGKMACGGEGSLKNKRGRKGAMMPMSGKIRSTIIDIVADPNKATGNASERQLVHRREIRMC